MEDIRQAISQAERELEAAEKAVASKRSALMASLVFFSISNLWLSFGPHMYCALVNEEAKEHSIENASVYLQN